MNWEMRNAREGHGFQPCQQVAIIDNAPVRRNCKEGLVAGGAPDAKAHFMIMLHGTA